MASGQIVLGLWGSAPNDIWAVGVAEGNHLSIVHWDGVSWEQWVLTTDRSDNYNPGCLWGNSANNIWAVGGDDDPTILRWDGSAWSTMPIIISEHSISVVWVSDTGDVWFAGYPDNVLRLRM